ncbi:MAG: shikimate dehydrogenase [Desulfotomaculum sp.]|nr:shikimate dehydrogenase [Desulfotomaculum sp.]MCL0052369.1 shikimate dehydrogenase [Peptococcaceae bacterium]MCL0063130.1 shikimate dehydrogenase [Peptococcaceae bacterium]MCL0106482.1 shikimate dehydrogenase [Peptococcaceae bacterium]MCL0107558.1 shikimate dehydrogenase [Peptococcaceae bacterium]
MLFINGETVVCGLFGYPVAHSFSPEMHNRAFDELGLNWAYLPFEVKPEHLSQAVEAVRALNLVGVNVTVPHKERVIEFLDEITQAAKTIGAVNVIVNDGGKLIGHNTDGIGFIKSLEEAKFNVSGKKAVVLGAGGAAKAVCVQLAYEGIAELTIVNRNIEKANKLASLISNLKVDVITLRWEQKKHIRDEMHNADLVVQATSIGMHPDNAFPPIPDDCFREGQIVCDLVYNPVNTKFLQAAKNAKATVVNGLGMLLYQGAAAFEMWTNKRAPVDVMRKVLVEKFK